MVTICGLLQSCHASQVQNRTLAKRGSNLNNVQQELPFTLDCMPGGKKENSSNFINNMRLPVHRWFRYSAGFSAAWTEDLILQESRNRKVRVFDPFVGSGTTLISAEQCEVESWGIDVHSFVARVAQAKLAYRSSSVEYLNQANNVFLSAQGRSPLLDSYASIVRRCYTDHALEQLDCLRRATESSKDDSEAARLVWLTLVSILRATSFVGTANWQYLLPRRRKARVQDPYSAYKSMMRIIHDDICLKRRVSGPRALFSLDDARHCKTVPSDAFNLVVTSPPYPNNYDYADATRLELAFLGEIQNWSDLQVHIRKNLLRSCTQHVPQKSIALNEILASPELRVIGEDIQRVCEKLAQIRLNHGGKKTYHNMVACYFFDLAQVWKSLRRICSSPSKVCFVIGDSAPYGVYVPAHEWLGRLAIEAGFSSFTFEKIRDRNTKWKNRKHRVPLCEGRLWVMG